MNAPIVGKSYVMTDSMKTQPADIYKKRCRIEDGRTYTDTHVQVTSVEDADDYWYVGYEPTGRDSDTCKFGYTRVYKNVVPSCGTISFVPLTA